MIRWRGAPVALPRKRKAEPSLASLLTRNVLVDLAYLERAGILRDMWPMCSRQRQNVACSAFSLTARRIGILP